MCACSAFAALDGYSPQQDPDQFHIQTDEDDERYFLYQTHNGQYRKERRLKDGSVVGKLHFILKYLKYKDRQLLKSLFSCQIIPPYIRPTAGPDPSEKWEDFGCSFQIVVRGADSELQIRNDIQLFLNAFQRPRYYQMLWNLWSHSPSFSTMVLYHVTQRRKMWWKRLCFYVCLTYFLMSWYIYETNTKELQSFM